VHVTAAFVWLFWVCFVGARQREGVEEKGKLRLTEHGARLGGHAPDGCALMVCKHAHITYDPQGCHLALSLLYCVLDAESEFGRCGISCFR
jgi:hypothetical protein